MLLKIVPSHTIIAYCNFCFVPQGILTAVISYLTGSSDPSEVGVMAKQATEVRKANFFLVRDWLLLVN